MKLLVIGDSHAGIFKTSAMANALNGIDIETVAVHGATVSGLPNPNAVTQSLAQFRKAIATANVDHVITYIGEVDTGFVIWYRASKYGESVARMFEQAVKNYQSLVDEVAQTSAPIVISTPLPTIRDGTQWGNVANARREVTVTQRERTELTLRFNDAMASFCRVRGYHYIDLDEASLGANGIVRPELLHSDPANHHYSPNAYMKLIVPRLWPILSNMSAAG